MKDLTLVITTHNSQQFLPRLLSNIINSDFDGKVLFLDDCSSDDSVNIIKLYKKKFPHIKIDVKAFDVNRGVATMRHLSQDLVKTKYVMCLDDDDVIDFSVLHQVYRHATPSKIITTYRVWINKSMLMRVNLQTNDREKYLQRTWTNVWGMIFPTKIFKELKLIDGQNYNEDLGVYPILVNHKFEFVPTKKPLYYYVARPSSALFDAKQSHEKTEKFFEQSFANFDNSITQVTDSLQRQMMIDKFLMQFSAAASQMKAFDLLDPFISKYNLDKEEGALQLINVFRAKNIVSMVYRALRIPKRWKKHLIPYIWEYFYCNLFHPINKFKIYHYVSKYKRTVPILALVN